MDHDGARRLMAEAIEGRLEADDERELALHLVGCDECKVVYEGLQQAHPALASIRLGEPTTSSVDAAVHRATTVLQAATPIPGPMGLTEEAPRLPDDPRRQHVRIDTSTTQSTRTSSLPRSSSDGTDERTGAGTVIPGGPARATDRDHEPTTDESVLDSPALPIDVPDVEQPVERHRRARRDLGMRRHRADQTDAVVEPPPRPIGVARASRTRPSHLHPQATSTDCSMRTGCGTSRSRYPDEDDERDRIGPGPWLIAIAIAVVLAVLAGDPDHARRRAVRREAAAICRRRDRCATTSSAHSPT